ncbi:ATP-binding protein [Streptomyces sp. S.PB5]|uniref:ATP-binding protein n=1 Tax=Streptomyces sp. S.PB5 TaxID=3020844 RepID=UPI0025B21540|nr:ATP-binding protein [Streptomyces sp. S.PB5]MDN3028437.1 ATP-binding protein [Streptomyces sp. S.PB5]
MLRRVAFRVPRHPASVGVARQRVRRHLAAWGYAAKSETAANAVLLVSEPAANVVRHAPLLVREFEVAVTAREDGSCLIEVCDQGPGLPVVVRDGEVGEAENGRGLRLVEAVAKEWGVRPDRHVGKTVWALIDAPPLYVPHAQHRHRPAHQEGRDD